MLYTLWQNQSALPNVNKNEMCLHVFIRSFTKGIYVAKKWEGVWHGVDVDQSWIPSNTVVFIYFLLLFLLLLESKQSLKEFKDSKFHDKFDTDS